MLEVLGAHAGEYVLVKNNPENPCRGIGDFKQGSITRLNVFALPESTDYQIKGDTIVALEQWYDSLNKWGSRFDQAGFAFINKGIKRHFVPTMGAVISQQTIYDASKAELSHSSTISTAQGRGEGLQTIKFQGKDSFVYTFVVNERNFFGKLFNSIPAGECEFARKQ